MMETPGRYGPQLLTVYEARARGREYCQTEGSDHYQGSSPEPLDLIISQGYAEGFCLGGAIKYAARYSRTRDLGDLKKAVDMLHIYCGVSLLMTELLEKEVRCDETAVPDDHCGHGRGG